jgi:hypothetical protein
MTLPDRAQSKWRVGPVSFVASLINVLMLVLSMWLFYISTFRGYEFFLPFFAVNLVLSVALSLLGGTLGRFGRGLLIGWLSVPTSLVLFIGGFAIANAFGPI